MSTSLQFTFINNQHGFTISLVEGHALMQQLSQIHNIGPHALEFWNKTLVGGTQLINFLKTGENLGFYIDSEKPYFRFKIEMSHNGTLRTLLLPEDFDDFPKTFTGKCRVNKVMLGKSPYTSVLDYNDFLIENIVNEVMEKSYQTNSRIYMSEDFCTSIMLTKLPPTNINKQIEDYEDFSFEEMLQKYSNLMKLALDLKASSIETIIELFATHGFKYLGSKEVKFHCPCSHERMVGNLLTLPQTDIDEIFSENSQIETRCDYCNTIYTIKKEEFDKNLQ
jgi:molecular chaperone Hsp33